MSHEPDRLAPLILYGMGSPNVRKVLIMLEELGLPYETRHVAVTLGDQFGPEFQAMNPLGKVPVLTDPNPSQPGAPLFESGAILIYLAETYGGGLLAPSGPERYAALCWLMAQMAQVGPMLGNNNHFLILPEGTGGYGAGRFADQSMRLYRKLDERLAASPWLGGEDYSIADIATWPWAAYLKMHGGDWADHPHLDNWSRSIRARPAVQRADAQYRRFQALDQEARARATPEQIDQFFGRAPPPQVSGARG
ncbi:MAG: glutathione S-transferase family protein [Caulobacteraceae bacterium]|nr:glutathione S-transferase family protein [Caulobacteraceae bacterium]